MMKRALRLIILLTLVVSFSFCWRTESAEAMRSGEKELLECWRIINQAYLDETFNHQNWWFLRRDFLKKPLDNPEQTYTAIEEMLATLDEPYTRLLRPQQFSSLQISTSGEFSGVGLQINLSREGNLEVVAPIAGSPAAQAGITTRDRILAIDGVDTATLTLDEAAQRMRGKTGTTVSLTILPREEDSSFTVELVRDRIALSSVYADIDEREGFPIGYLRLSQFSASSAQEIKAAIEEFEQEGVDAYILDLRNNPGGLLQAGIEIARLWIDGGSIVYTVDRRGTVGSYNANGTAITQDPLIVLVNEGTASAGEILAGALQDNGRGLLVGKTTFGKGLIQSLFELGDGAGLAVTVAKYETPARHDINHLGITPDRLVAQEPIFLAQLGTEVDLQYQKAVELLRD